MAVRAAGARENGPGRTRSVGPAGSGRLAARSAALDVLWLDPVRGIVECHECGEKATVIVDGLGPADLLDPLSAWDGHR
ncbi:hypothetical protein AAH991_20080 [Microbispora sp. ZYX-F-249]|uniref:Trm112 family protein n=1 Tax=Microbispora maris TaxID=3144104 RepID=A0ABV0ATA1_9ACTN